MSAAFYVLAVMWAIGTLVGTGFFIREMTDSKVVMVVGWLIGFPVWVLVALGPIALLKHESGPTLTTLLKSGWQCSAAHQETTTNMILVGKIMVPNTATVSVCDQYSRGATP